MSEDDVSGKETSLQMWAKKYAACNERSLFGSQGKVPQSSQNVVISIEIKPIFSSKQRYMLFLDSIHEIKQYCNHVWTIRHVNGIVFQIPASAITEEQIAFLQEKMEYGKTPEGIQAAIDRGRMIEEYKEQRNINYFKS